ncbi:MAG TPA: iron-sulfur cluster assembly scaffold protein [bacterium]|nr:iron-sulfur cluster assembly scaffold protein [bacterium]HPL95220.1 iron-sulfur cluster assembly scaffold protein [bacterium]
MYSPIVLEHFKNPHNQGSIADADAVGQVGNPVCGDIMKLYIKFREADKSLPVAERIIEDVKFETLGCGAAIASTSMLTDLIKGKTVTEALKVSKQDVAEALGGLPAAKIHCSILATEALEEAIKKLKN